MILSYLRTAFLYLVLVLAVRMMGKRQIGQMEASEFVVTMLVANLAAIPMQDAAIPLYSGLVPILTVLGMELVLSGLILRSMALRRLFCGKPVILIENGTIVQENLRATRVSLDELTAQLRLKNVLDLRTIQYAILETSGALSVFLYPRDAPASAREAGLHPRDQHLPVTIVEDGYVSRENLQRAGKDRLWVDKILAQQQATLEETLLLTVDRGDRVLFIRKELP